MSIYLLLKVVHIISATLLFGTGLGSAYYMWMAHLTKNPQIIATTTKHVILADWMFTTPTIFIQPITGLAMLYIIGMNTDNPWFMLDRAWIIWTFILYFIAGACWLPVVWIQIKVNKIAAEVIHNKTELPPLYYRLMTFWFLLGWPAFLGMVVIFFLMVFRPS